MIPWGDDFTYANSHLTFGPLDALIPYFNEHYDDMFPYADQAEDYWTGYFTSRADAKE